MLYGQLWEIHLDFLKVETVYNMRCGLVSDRRLLTHPLRTEFLGRLTLSCIRLQV